MKPVFNLRKAVESRYSVRTYSSKTMPPELKTQLLNYAGTIENPFGAEVRLQFVEKELAPNGEKLGTYGIIKGTNRYLGVTVSEAEFALEGLGYSFEQFVLYAASLGLGTCWLGGTFNKSAFAQAMDIREGEVFPILSPIGYPAEKKSLTEKIMRTAVKAGERLPWEKIFFSESFEKPVSRGEAGEYNYAFEMLRLAPSAVNKQPWRIVADGDSIHFFKKHSDTAQNLGIDMQRIDMGIAMAHFDLAMQEQGTEGCFEKIPVSIDVPQGLKYIISWKKT